MAKPRRFLPIRRLLKVAGHPAAAGAQFWEMVKLRRRAGSTALAPPRPGVLVSLTSFPERVPYLWATIETLLQQTVRPEAVILVLAEQEFPDRRLPAKLTEQQSRGLRLLWVEGNLRSYKKLVHTRGAYPEHAIITVDDDVLYDPRLVETLLGLAEGHPGAIIGNSGRRIRGRGRLFEPYATWPNVRQLRKGYDTLLTGVGGILYPPGLLPDMPLLDVELAMRLAPSSDDIWFWAASREAGVPTVCAGRGLHREILLQQVTSRLAKTNRGGGRNDVQFERVLNHFGIEL